MLRHISTEAWLSPLLLDGQSIHRLCSTIVSLMSNTSFAKKWLWSFSSPLLVNPSPSENPLRPFDCSWHRNRPLADKPYKPVSLLEWNVPWAVRRHENYPITTAWRETEHPHIIVRRWCSQRLRRMIPHSQYSKMFWKRSLTKVCLLIVSLWHKLMVNNRSVVPPYSEARSMVYGTRKKRKMKNHPRFVPHQHG